MTSSSSRAADDGSQQRPIVLDCTLRDGGNQNDWQFSETDIERIVSGLDAAGVDVIEVGYRGGSGSKSSHTAGPTAHCTDAFLAALPRTQRATLAVMVVPTVCSLDAVESLANSRIGMVRVAAYPWDIEGTLPYLHRVRELGMLTTVNLMAVSYTSAVDLQNAARIVAQAQPDVFYMADSFGALTPSGIQERIRAVKAELDCPVGIHAHNNLGLAAANALAGVDAGASWIDASLRGMARGAGNLVTEQIAAILTAWDRFQTILDLPAVCAVAEYVEHQVLPEPMPLGTAEIAAGINDHHYYYVPHLQQVAQNEDVDQWELGARLGRRRPHKVDLAEVRTAAKEIKSRTADPTPETAQIGALQ